MASRSKLLPNQAVYVMGRKGKRKFTPCGKRKFTPCGKCGFPVKPGRKYVIDPVDTLVVYHAECYRQQYRREQR